MVDIKAKYADIKPLQLVPDDILQAILCLYDIKSTLGLVISFFKTRNFLLVGNDYCHFATLRKIVFCFNKEQSFYTEQDFVKGK